MATSKKASDSSFQTEVDNLASGFTTSTSSILSSLIVDGVSMTRADILTKLKAILALFTAVLQTKQAYAAAVAAKKAGVSSAHAFVESLVASLKQTLGSANQAQLSAFGVAPPKERSQPSTETKAIAKVKGQATRLARGTMSKKGKLSITATPKPTLQVLGPDGQPLLPAGSNPPASPASPASPAKS